MRLPGRRVLVFGASSGIGRAAGMAIATEGARVAFAARRTDRLESAVAEAGGDSLAVTCDVRDEASVDRAVADTVAAFGGLDALVYAPGISSWDPLVELDAETWRTVLDTNLIGATVAARAAMPHLERSNGKAVFYSSISIDDQPPRHSQATYVVSKVALEALVRAWQGEHRRVGFTTIAMGDTLSEFGHDADGAKLAPIVRRWADEGYMYGRMMDPRDVAAQVVNVLASPETVRRLAITPHYPHDEPEGGRDWGDAAMKAQRGAKAD